tara:strand:+ start:331 stop:510 length:180 start_codon:yes stop_codon:yes gene_type:complete
MTTLKLTENQEKLLVDSLWNEIYSFGYGDDDIDAEGRKRIRNLQKLLKKLDRFAGDIEY